MEERAWWREGVVYQIYCRSYKDTTGDGYGDLRGIIEKIPYLKELGVTIVWLNPIYASPGIDNGYDISDYQAINPLFGTMADFDEMLEKMHEAGIKLVMDLVVNHSSDQHPWFLESRTGKGDKKDWYIWSKQPNNWRSFFSGSTWKYDEMRQEYYLHLFCEEQPDLNWENDEVKKAVYEMMNWWFKKGIDGFRMDVINFISKVPGFPNGEDVGLDGYADGSKYFANGPKIHEYLKEMNREVLSKYDCFTVGEMPGATPAEALKYTGVNENELQMVFTFEHVDIGYNKQKWYGRPWKLTELKENLYKWQVELEGKGWNSLYLSNHDQPRQISRWGNDKEYRVESGKMLATMLHTLKGTPYVYQGEEIGMINVDFGRIEDYQDCEILGKWEELKKTKEMTLEQFLQRVALVGRDNARTPMQWDDSENAGFTQGKPWLKVNPSYKTINVKEAMADPNSLYHYYKKLIQMRKDHPIMAYGTVNLILRDHEEIFAYTKTYQDKQWLVILNFFGNQVEFILPEDIEIKSPQLLLSNYAVPEGESIKKIMLKPYEARIYQL